MKKITFGISILFFIFGFIPAFTAHAAVTDNLAAYWHLNEEAGETRIDSLSASDLAETSGSVLTATGKIGNAVSFAGAGSPYLSVSDNNSISACNCDFTVAGWVYLTDTAQNYGIVGKYSTNAATREYLLGYRVSDNRFIFTVTNSSSAATTVAANNFGTPSANTWYYVVGWYDATADTLNIQVNDGVANSTSQTTGIRNGTLDLTIGPYTTGTTGSGRTDMVGIWRQQVVSASDRTALYNAGAGLEIYITPSAPTTFVATGSDSAITAQWSAVAGATDYIVEYKLSSEPTTWTTFSDGVSTKRGATITGLTNGLSYDVRVSVTVNTVTSSPTTPLTGITPTAGYDYNFYNHVLSTGQSLSLGATGTPVLTSTQPYNNKKLTSNTGSFTPLIEVTQESMSSALANMISSLVSPESNDSIVTMHGVGATAYAGLKKGTTPYSNGITQMNTSFNNALAEGAPYRVSAITVIHGEADAEDGFTGAQYQGFLEEWQSDYQTDIQAVTGQTGTIPLFTDQMSSWTSYTAQVPTVTLGQLQAARDNPGVIYLVTPKYIFDYNDHAHLTNVSYRRLGEYYGKIMKRVLIDGDSWEPFAPTNITRQGNIIYADFHVPVPPLVLDTTRVTLQTDYGFEYYDSTSSASITSVELEDSDTVKITLNTTPTGSDQRLRYAYTGAGETDDTAGNRPGRDQANSARGNLRDSDSQASLYTGGLGTMGTVLYNWAATFDDPIVDATAAPDAPTNLSAVAGDTEVELFWDSPLDDGGSAITDYLVEYKLTSELVTWSTFSDGTSTTTSATVTGLTNGLSYDFRVSAINAIGTSTASATDSATPTAVATAPDAPTSLAAVAGDTEVDLSWTAPVDDGGSVITDYVIEYKLTSEPTTWTTFTDGTSTTTTTTVTGLTNELSYDFRVSAVNAIGTSSPSSTDSATPTAGTTAPDAPTALAASAGDTDVELTWTAPADDGGSAITDYLVEYKLASSGTWGTFADGTSTSTTATVTGLTNDLAYDFRVSAINAIGTSSVSATASATPTSSSPAPTPSSPSAGSGYTSNPTDIPGVTVIPPRCAPGARFDTMTGAPCTSGTTVTPAPNIPTIFTRDLKLGDTGADVRALQVFLNTHGFTLATTGPGAPGNETTFFGTLTKAALIRFQEAYAAQILTPLGLMKGTGYFGMATKAFLETL